MAGRTARADPQAMRPPPHAKPLLELRNVGWDVRDDEEVLGAKDILKQPTDQSRHAEVVDGQVYLLVRLI